MTRKSITALLFEDPIYWTKVRERVEAGETAEDFIHKLCLLPTTVPPLFLDWVLEQPFAATQLESTSGLMRYE